MIEMFVVVGGVEALKLGELGLEGERGERGVDTTACLR